MKEGLFQDYGVGVGYRPEYRDIFVKDPVPSVQWLEVISENYMRWREGRRTRGIQTLRDLAKNYPIALHGVSLNLGSADQISRVYLSHLKELIDDIEPIVISDHLCWTGVGGQRLHDLMPLPYTQEAIDNTVRHIQQVQEFLQKRILIENLSSYVTFSHSEMTEWEFLVEVANRSDCGILLDINNIYVSSVNHDFDPMTYLAAIPVERVGQIHLAGHTDQGDYLVDTHDASVCEEVWELYASSLKLLGRKSTMIERDDHFPSWSLLEEELKKIEELRREFSKNDAEYVPRGRRPSSAIVSHQGSHS